MEEENHETHNMKHETESAPQRAGSPPSHPTGQALRSENKEIEKLRDDANDDDNGEIGEIMRDDGINDDVKDGVDGAQQNMNLKKAIGVVGVFICGIGILVFGVMRIKNIIVSPFEDYGNLHTNNANDANYANMQMDEMAALKSKDTDGDGINDYDEIYVYGTSAFIEDTDSDGISDFEELQSGEDPLCPRGQDCYMEQETRNEKEETRDDVPNNSSLMTNDLIDVAELRQMLAEAGMDENALNSIDDITLLELYNETIAETDVDSLINTNQNTNDTNHEFDTDIDMEELENLSVEQIRALMIEAGADAEMLGQIDDETLRQIYLETLGEME